MPDILLVVFAVVFVLGVAINIHEFGHFIVARLLGMRVEAYSFFGIGPRIWGFKRGHTDYRISAIPLGAYVKLYGDEATEALEGGSSDGEEVPEAELYELRPRWQKFLVMIGGPFMNIVLALAIPFVIALYMGVPSVPAPIVGAVVDGGSAQMAGLKAGDRIVEFDGVKDPTWSRVLEDAMLLSWKGNPGCCGEGREARSFNSHPCVEREKRKQIRRSRDESRRRSRSRRCRSHPGWNARGEFWIGDR